MDKNTCKDCIFFKKHNKNLIYGYCISNESHMRSKYLRTELSPACKSKKTK